LPAGSVIWSDASDVPGMLLVTTVLSARTFFPATAAPPAVVFDFWSSTIITPLELSVVPSGNASAPVPLDAPMERDACGEVVPTPTLPPCPAK
jgi:hypothetical protein